MDEIILSKLCATVVMLILALLASFLPLKIRGYLINQSEMSEKMTMITLSASLCFGAGVLMATVFLHIMIETRERFLILIENGYIPDIEYPLPELIMCVGFFLIYFTEELVHLWVHRQHEKEHHNIEQGTEHASFKRRGSTYSIRSSIKRCESSGSVVVLSGCEGQMSSCCEESHKNEGGSQYMNSVKTADLGPQTNGGGQIVKNDLLIIPEDIPSLSVSKPDDNDGENDNGMDEVSLFRSILVILALSLHGMFEGIALGLESDPYDVWLLCAALSAHKIFIGFSIGMELLEIGIKKSLFTFHMMVFSLASPTGAVFGTVLSATVSPESVGGAIAMAILQGISGGTILYVTFCEVLERERTKVSGRFIRLLALMAGFFVMAFLQAFDTGHNHSDSHAENSTDLPKHFDFPFGELSHIHV